MIHCLCADHLVLAPNVSYRVANGDPVAGKPLDVHCDHCDKPVAEFRYQPDVAIKD